MSSENKTAIITFTNKGIVLALDIKCGLEGETHVFTSKKDAASSGDFRLIQGELKSFIGECFRKYDSLVFISSTGIAVRLIAGFIKDKFSDPAVLVIDDMGEHVISLLSGHIGGANELCVKISGVIGSKAVITTATDVNDVMSFDMLLKRLNIKPDKYRDEVKLINSLLLDKKKVAIVNETEYLVEEKGTVKLEFEEALKDDTIERIIYICYTPKLTYDHRVLYLLPRDVVVGVGCRRGLSYESLMSSFNQVLEAEDILAERVAMIASIDLKKDEKAILLLGEKLGVPVLFHSGTELSAYEKDSEASAFVKSVTGVSSVAQASAMKHSDTMITGKVKKDKCTFALGKVYLKGMK